MQRVVYIATNCTNTLQHTATYRNVLQRFATHCNDDTGRQNARKCINDEEAADNTNNCNNYNTLLHAVTRCNILQQRISKTKRQEMRPSMCRQRGKLCQPPCPLAPFLCVSFLHTPKNRVNEHISAGTCPLLQMSQQSIPKASVAVCCSLLQSAVVCCNMLQYVAMCCSVLQCVAACCSVFSLNKACLPTEITGKGPVEATDA